MHTKRGIPSQINAMKARKQDLRADSATSAGARVSGAGAAHGLQRALGNQALGLLLGTGPMAPGQALPPPLRAEMEQRFGQDFTGVQIHRGNAAAAAARAVGANAFTLGQHIVFGAGHYAPHTNTGRALLAHELAHVVQQGRGGFAPAPGSGGALEAGAAQAASAVTQGSGPVQVTGASGVGIAAEDDAFTQARHRELQRAMLAGLLVVPKAVTPNAEPPAAPGSGAPAKVEEDPLKNPGASKLGGPGAPYGFDGHPPTTLGSDVQLQNLGPTQNAWVPRAIRPYATLELTGSGLLQSPTDPAQGWTGQAGGGAQARFTLNPNTEIGFGGTYGHVFTLGGIPLSGPANVGSVYGSLHFSQTQPRDKDNVDSAGAGFFAQGGALLGAGPKGERGWYLSGLGAYSWGWPGNTFFKGLDVNAGLSGAEYGQINGVYARGLVQPFASASLSLPLGLNFESYASLPVGAGGNLSDPTASGAPLSFRLGAGLGVQIPFGDYAIGAEIGVAQEFANTRSPGASYGNFSPWLNIGVGAVKRRVTFGDVSLFPARF